MKKLNSKNKKIILSVMALVEVIILAAGITFSWIEGGNKGNVNGNDIVISTGSNLTMKYGNKVTNSITIPKCVLDEVSSADGRNYYFPLKDNTSSETSQMKFREGTPADENKKYLSLDFQLTADKGAVDVYLGAGTLVQCSNDKVMNALRMSFSKNDGSTPIVFKPNQMPGVTMPYYPIVSITEEGTPTTSTVNTKAYADYSYNGADSTPIFHLEGGQTLNITLSLWLEGTAFSDDVSNQDLGIYIDFTTTVDDLIKYTFIDNTHGYSDGKPETWVSNKDILNGSTYETMMYVYDYSSSRYYAMNKINDTKWEAYIPKSITSFYFRRYSIDIDQWWNEWEPSMTSIPTYNNERVFVAICGNGAESGTELAGCYGYWKDSDGTFRIYFEMEAPYSNLHCYAWNTSGSACASTGAWPGKGMTFVKNTKNGVLYYIDLKESENVAGIQFNNGGETRVYLDGFNYSVDTAAYVYYNDSNNVEKKPLGDWPGTVASYDANNSTANYWVDFTVSQVNQGREFKIIANNNNKGSQYPASGGAVGNTGNVYKFTNNSTTLAKLAGPYDIKDDKFDDYIFNGSVFWYKSDSENGFYIYRDKESSLIYPVNQ